MIAPASAAILQKHVDLSVKNATAAVSAQFSQRKEDLGLNSRLRAFVCRCTGSHGFSSSTQKKQGMGTSPAQLLMQIQPIPVGPALRPITVVTDSIFGMETKDTESGDMRGKYSVMFHNGLLKCLHGSQTQNPKAKGLFKYLE